MAQQQEMANLAKDVEAESFVLDNDDCDESYDELGFVAVSRLATEERRDESASAPSKIA